MAEDVSSPEILAGLVSILIEVVDHLGGDGADLGWSSRREVAEAREDYADHLERVRSGDLSRLRELRVAFAPTGELQEASMASGWVEDYLELAAHFDGLTTAL